MHNFFFQNYRSNNLVLKNDHPLWAFCWNVELPLSVLNEDPFLNPLPTDATPPSNEVLIEPLSFPVDNLWLKEDNLCEAVDCPKDDNDFEIPLVSLNGGVWLNENSLLGDLNFDDVFFTKWVITKTCRSFEWWSLIKWRTSTRTFWFSKWRFSISSQSTKWNPIRAFKSHWW